MSRPNAAPSSTLFLPELPSMLTDGELEPHFRNFPGFAGSRTRKDRNGKLVGFVEFDMVDSAVRAKESMQKFSPFPGTNWQIHFSNNTKSAPPKRPRDDNGREAQLRSEAQRHSGYMNSRPPVSSSVGQMGGQMAPPPAPQFAGHGGQVQMHRQPPPPPQPSTMSYQQPPHSYQVVQMDPSHRIPQQPPAPNYLAQLARDASSCLYVEGLPSDVTEREVGQIFRRFEGQGYQSIRIVSRDSKLTPGKSLHLCFVEFDNAHQATHAMHQLQGYRVDKSVEGSGIRISYSKQRSERRGSAPRMAARTSSASGGSARPRKEEMLIDEDGGTHDERDRRSGRRDGREHRDEISNRDEYEESERGDVGDDIDAFSEVGSTLDFGD